MGELPKSGKRKGVILSSVCVGNINIKSDCKMSSCTWAQSSSEGRTEVCCVHVQICLRLLCNTAETSASANNSTLTRSQYFLIKSSWTRRRSAVECVLWITHSTCRMSFLPLGVSNPNNENKDLIRRRSIRSRHFTVKQPNSDMNQAESSDEVLFLLGLVSDRLPSSVWQEIKCYLEGN